MLVAQPQASHGRPAELETHLALKCPGCPEHLSKKWRNYLAVKETSQQ
ncbi:4508_t:CDS:2 [Ambispora gerdemannii]|uniref:4508_t:CDS:1 n=1 Tax=Ambispora gerdemannii TaxID=144530 RepID=A0A9N9CDM0_9GLOM|nr:4508_t:CDS:2 [Ambispora gerdemannii]